VLRGRLPRGVRARPPRRQWRSLLGSPAKSRPWGQHNAPEGSRAPTDRVQMLDKAASLNSVRAPVCPRAEAAGTGQLPGSHCILGGSSNGRTADSGSAYQGSNPCPPAGLARQSALTSPTPLALASLAFDSYRGPFVLPLLALFSRFGPPGPHRLAVRTPASHVGNTGSIPVGVAKFFPGENGKRQGLAHQQSDPVTELSDGLIPACFRHDRPTTGRPSRAPRCRI
jgi:hypothetical protein